jgi:hypothetical protein
MEASIAATQANRKPKQGYIAATAILLLCWELRRFAGAEVNDRCPLIV